jgi:hypothetical protein
MDAVTKLNQPPTGADRLREMLKTLVEHRQQHAQDQPAKSIIITNFSSKPLPPQWVSRMQNAAKDGVKESLHASIREEGWRAYAEGGLKAMHQLADDACADNNHFASILDHRWDGIGTDKNGHWVC